jgi:uncharacterized membrane protein
MVTPRRIDAIAAWICTAYAIAFTGWSIVWRQRFAERSADEAIFENLLWNATHGNGLRTWVEHGFPHLAIHFSPILYLLLPLYALGGMVAIHALVTAATAIAGFALQGHVSRRLDPRAALPLLIAFLLNPTIVLQTFMEFHEQALITLPLVMLLIAWDEGRSRRTVLWSAALLSIREDNLLLVLALGALSLLSAPRRRMAVTLLIAGAVWIVAWRVISFGVLGAGRVPSIFAETYHVWGTTPGAALRSIATHPLTVLGHVMSPVPLGYLAVLLAPFLLVLPFGSPIVLVMLPQLMLVLLAGFETRMFEIRMHFSLAPVIVLFFASIATLARIGSAPARWAAWVRRWAPLLMAVVALALAPVWVVRAIRRLNPYTTQARLVIASVSDTSSVTAPGYLINHLARRREIALEWNEELPRTEWVILEDRSRSFFEGRRMDIFYSPRADSALIAAGYEKTYQRDGWYVFRRGVRR